MHRSEGVATQAAASLMQRAGFHVSCASALQHSYSKGKAHTYQQAWPLHCNSYAHARLPLRAPRTPSMGGQLSAAVLRAGMRLRMVL